MLAADRLACALIPARPGQAIRVRQLPMGHQSGLHCGDNLPFMQQQPGRSIDLIYIDPPFIPGRIQRYLDFLRPRLQEMHRLLRPTGSLFVHLDWRTVHHVRVALDEIFGPPNFANEIIWAYRSGGSAKRWFARKHDTILWYARRLGQHCFAPQRAGSYRTDGLCRDRQGRPYKQTRRGRLYFDPRGPLLTDVWDIPFLSTVSAERTGHRHQKPLALLTRIIQAASRPGQLVADFFAGSGTTLVAAKQLGRRWLGCDIDASAVRLARRRLQSAQATPPSAGKLGGGLGHIS